jgi:photosystem II stability/assembly factor-like uncharacterized protein
MYAASGGDGYFGPGSQSGLYKTTDGGATWAQANLGLVDPVVEALWFDPATTSRLLAGTWTGIFRSTDNGDHWTPAHTCTAISSSVGPVNAFLQVGGVLFAASGLGLLQSIDHGDTWCIEQPTQSPVGALSASGGALYMGLRDGHVMVRANAGGAWLSTVPSPSGGGVRSVAANLVDPNICYAATVAYPQSLYVTKDGGHTWNIFQFGPGRAWTRPGHFSLPFTPNLFLQKTSKELHEPRAKPLEL